MTTKNDWINRFNNKKQTLDVGDRISFIEKGTRLEGKIIELCLNPWDIIDEIRVETLEGYIFRISIWDKTIRTEV